MHRQTLTNQNLNVKLLERIENIRLTSLKLEQTPISFYESIAIYFAGGLSKYYSSDETTTDYLLLD